MRAAPAVAQSGVGTILPPIVQPAEKTKAAFLARAHALRDHAVTKAIKRMALQERHDRALGIAGGVD